MSSFEFVQLSQTLNDIVGIFQILTLNRVRLNETKQAYLYSLKPVLLFILQTVFLALTENNTEAVSIHGLHWRSSTKCAI